MQFREFGEWIARMSSGTETYLVFGHPDEIGPLEALAKEAGVEQRFRFMEIATPITPGRIWVLVQPEGEDASLAADPLGEALEAAIKSDLKSQLFDEQATQFERGGPGVFHLLGEDDDTSATHPHGEHDLLSQVIDRLDGFLREIFTVTGEKRQ